MKERTGTQGRGAANRLAALLLASTALTGLPATPAAAQTVMFADNGDTGLHTFRDVVEIANVDASVTTVQSMLLAPDDTVVLQSPVNIDRAQPLTITGGTGPFTLTDGPGILPDGSTYYLLGLRGGSGRHVVIDQMVTLHTTGANVYGVYGTGGDHTVELAGTIVTEAGGAHGIRLLGGGHTIDVSGRIETQGSAAYAIADNSGSNTVTISGEIETSGSSSPGVQLGLGGNTVTLAAGGKITTSGSSSTGVALGSNNNTVDIHGAIVASGASGIGVRAPGAGNEITLHAGGSIDVGGSTAGGLPAAIAVIGSTTANPNVVTVAGRIGLDGNSARGVEATGDGAQIVVTDTGRIESSDPATRTNRAQRGIEVDGDINWVEVHGDIALLRVDRGASFGTSAGIYARGNDNFVTVGATGTIETAGDAVQGIQAEGDRNEVTVAGEITTTGAGAHGVFVSGDDNHIYTNRITTTGAGAWAVRVNGGDGDGDSVGNEIRVSGEIVATGQNGGGVFVDGPGPNSVQVDLSGSIEVGEAGVVGGVVGISLSGSTAAGRESVDVRGRITLEGDDARGIQSTGDSAYIYVAEPGRIVSGGDDSADLNHSQFGIHVTGDDNVVEVAGGIALTRENRTVVAHLTAGVRVDGDGNRVTLEATGSPGSGRIDTNGGYIFGISAVGDDNEIEVDGVIATKGDYAYGVVATGDYNRIGVDGVIETEGLVALGVRAQGSGNRIEVTGDIVTTGDVAYGVVAVGAGNEIEVALGGSITTDGNSAHGIRADGDDNLIKVAGEITTTSDNAHGVHASGDRADIEVSGRIATSGVDSNGIRVEGDDATIRLSGEIETLSTSGGYGIQVLGSGSDITLVGGAFINSADTAIFLSDAAGGDHTVVLEAGSEINHTGNDSAIFAYGDGNTFQIAGEINTFADYASGLALDGANATVTLEAGGQIDTRGEGAVGVDAGSGGGNHDIAINGAIFTDGVDVDGVRLSGDDNALVVAGSITTGGDEAYGVRVGGSNNTVILTGSSAVSASGADAHGVSFSSGATGNRLELHSGFSLSATDGALARGGGTATLTLGGDDNGSFDIAQIGEADGYAQFAEFDKRGDSTWTLTGDNDTVDWTVRDGTLMVDGTAGGMEVLSGAALGGTGTVGATVIEDGGHLIGVQGQTLTLVALELNHGSVVDVSLGAPGDTALFDVAFDLTLDGTLNVSDAGGFGVGVYRLFDYGGTLSGPGLDIGATPIGVDPSELTVQTSVLTQVNLVYGVYTGDLLFWDGDGNGGNDQVDGGDGEWSLTNTNWTNADGSANGEMRPVPGFAIFQANGGTVTVDNGDGQVSVTGMQFAADGYVVTGGAVDLAGDGGNAVIRVGDGTGAGASYTATIESDLTGPARLVKTDLGTLVLTGNNDYAGGTTVKAGTLVVDGGSIAHAGQNMTVGDTAGDNGELVIQNGGTVASWSGRVGYGSGSNGSVTVTGAGSTWNNVTSLNVGNSGAGALLVEDGGTVTNGTGYIGYDGVGTVTVTGEGSTWTNSESLIVGFDGAGTLLVEAGGQVTSDWGFLGLDSGDGTVTVTGEGSTWNNTNDLYVGNVGAGALTVADGGLVTASATILAWGADSTGALNLDSGGVLLTGQVSKGAGDGSVTFDGGVLRLTGDQADLFDGFAAGQVTFAAGGALIDTQGHRVETAASLSGPGGLTKLGTGTLVLTGTNSYGDTTVVAGTLIGDSGSISGDIANAGTVVFAQATDATFAGDIGGHDGTDGVMVKDGAGRLTLAGTSSLDWTIGDGAVITAAERFGGNAALATGGELVFDQAADASSGILLSGDGTGTFTKTGVGLLTLTGDNSGYTGHTDIDGGTLDVADTLGGSLAVNAGGMLIGGGTVGDTVVGDGGVVSPGAAGEIGTLTVDGDLTFEEGSTYVAHVEAPGGADRIVVTGEAAVNGGAVEIVKLSPELSYMYGQSYRLIDAASVTVDNGGFAVDQPFLFLNAELEYGTNYIDLLLSRKSLFSDVAATYNQFQAANALDDLAQSGDALTVFNELLVMTDADEARRAFDLVSGEVHASGQHVVDQTMRLFSRTLSRQGKVGSGPTGGRVHTAPLAYGSETRSAGSDALDGMTTAAYADTRVASAWLAPLGGGGSVDADGNAAELDWWTAGVAGGYEVASGNAKAGFAFGYMRSRGTVDARLSGLDADNYQIGVYGGWANGPWQLTGSLAYGASRVETERRIVFGGIDRTAVADYWAHSVGFSGEAAYAFAFGAGTTISPVATLDAGWSGHDGFAETGAGALNLIAGAQSWTRLDTGLGLALAHTVPTDGGSLTFEARAMWEHAFADVAPSQTLALAGSPTGFEVLGPDAGRDRFRLGAGLAFEAADGLTVRASYTGVFSGRQLSHAASVGFNMKF